MFIRNYNIHSFLYGTITSIYICSAIKLRSFLFVFFSLLMKKKLLMFRKNVNYVILITMYIWMTTFLEVILIVSVM